MMEKTWITLDEVIREIEGFKYSAYELYAMFEKYDDPSMTTQLSQRLLGQQMAYDTMIKRLLEMQGSDGE